MTKAYQQGRGKGTCPQLSLGGRSVQIFPPPHFFVTLNTAMSMNLLGKSNMFAYSEKDRVIIAAKLEQKAAVADLFD